MNHGLNSLGLSKPLFNLLRRPVSVRRFESDIDDGKRALPNGVEHATK